MSKIKKEKKPKVKKKSIFDKLFDKIKKCKIAIPKTTPQIIRMFFEDFNENSSIIKLDENHFSVSLEYQDISFSKANYEEQETIFLKWVDYLHSFNYK